MGSIYVSFIVKSVSVCTENTESLEKSFQNIYKPVIKFLFSHPSFPLSFGFSGPQIQFFKKRKNELITILRELVDRKQVEILGGGYNEPLLPLLNSVDRNGQIDLLTSEIRQTFGKRPRGMTLFQDCWDSSLVNNIHTCGIEYVILNSQVIPESKRMYLPILMSDLGKNVDIFPYYNDLLPDEEMLAEEFVYNIEKAVLKAEKKDTHLQLDADRIIALTLTPEQAAHLIDVKWFEKLGKFIDETKDGRVKLTTLNSFRNNGVKIKLPLYIPVGISEEVSKIIQQSTNESRSRFPSTIYDFMYAYPESKKLYNRMMYISLLVNQYKTDKMRKKTAREKLWQAQNGMPLLSTSSKPLNNAMYRQLAYKYLTEAEKIIRGDGNFKESVTCFDYDNDGIDEYVCRMDQYFAFISLAGGCVPELDIIKDSYNYADNLKRSFDYDSYFDDYDRGFFIDHLFTNSQLDLYVRGEPAGDGVFSRIQYSQLKYSPQHHEVSLCARAIWKPTGQAVYLKKKYVINSTGMYVQYIIKNESDKTLNATFAVESNISDVSFITNQKTGFNIETVDNGEVVNLDTNNSTQELYKKGKLNNVQIVRLSDKPNGISFVFEPNEKCSYSLTPIKFRRPGFDRTKTDTVGLTYASALFWDISIEPGRETEKSINFTIIPVKKIKK